MPVASATRYTVSSLSSVSSLRIVPIAGNLWPMEKSILPAGFSLTSTSMSPMIRDSRYVLMQAVSPMGQLVVGVGAVFSTSNTGETA